MWNLRASWAWLLVLACLAPAAAAQEEAEEGLRGEAEAALLDLTGALASADTIRERVDANAAAIATALETLDKPLPDPPGDVLAYPDAPLADLEAEHDRHEAYRTAVLARQAAVQAGVEHVAARAQLIEDWIAAEQTLREKAVSGEQALVALRGAVDAGELTAEQAALAGERDAAAWMDRIRAIHGERPAGPGEEGDSIDLEAVQARLEAETEFDPETWQALKLQHQGSETLVAAVNVEATDIAELQEADVGEVLGVLDQRLADWRDGEKSTEVVRAAAAELRAQLAALEQERAALATPLREDFDGGEGHPELVTARRDLAFEQALLELVDQKLALLRRADALGVELRTAVQESETPLLSIGRRVVYLRGAIVVVESLAEQGQAELPGLAPGERREELWKVLKTLCLAVAERDLEFEELQGFTDALTQDAERERERQERLVEAARKTLELEEGYAELLVQIVELSDEELIAALMPDSEPSLAQVEAEEHAVAMLVDWEQARAAIGAVFEALETLPSPFTQQEIDRTPGRGLEIVEELEELTTLSMAAKPLPLDASDDAGHEGRLRVEVRTEFLAPGEQAPTQTLYDEVRPTVVELNLLKRQQRAARARLRYYQELEELVTDIGEAGAAEIAAADACVAALAEQTRLLRLRFAAARELRKRIGSGRIDAELEPPDLASWIDAPGIEEVQQRSRVFRSDVERLRAPVQLGLDRYAVFVRWKQWAEVGGQVAEEKVRLIAKPVDHIEAARRSIEDLREYERENLDYEASQEMSAGQTFWMRLLRVFADTPLRDRFEKPLKAYYLELANVDRIKVEYEQSSGAFAELAEVVASHEQDLPGAIEVLEEAERLRQLDYEAARYLAAIAARPTTHITIAARFYSTYGYSLPVPEDTRDWDQRFWATRLLTAEARLWADRRWLASLEHRAWFALDNEVNRYRASISQIDVQVAELDAKAEQIRQRIARLDQDYEDAAERHALQTLGKIAVIPIAAMIIVALLRRMALRFKKRARTDPAMTDSERQRRLETLTDVSGASITVVVWVIAGIYLLAQLGLDVTPIIASASVAGLALAFGAQALIRDYFAGFNILLENQYTVGDVIDVGIAAGVVERISLRVTVLRDLEGVVHYVPNGLVQRVSNKTKGWSRVLLEVGVAYGEDIDRVTTILKEILVAMEADEVFSQKIIEEPQVLGVERMEDSTVTVRLLVKTLPGAQWETARELRARIKRRFDAEGIKAPYQHRVVHHVDVGGTDGAAPTPDAD